MSRPALSASRALDIIELLSTFPDREFTLSEVSRATSINSASCHAVLTVLADRGYLTRLAGEKSYQLGPSLIASGQAGLKSQQVIARAKRVAVRLARDLDLPVMLSTVVGDEILAVITVENTSGRDAGMSVGERLPLIAPIGAPFLAWAGDQEIEAWMARRSNLPNSQMAKELKLDIELTRARGYQISLRPDQAASIGSLMMDLSYKKGVPDYKYELNKLINSMDIFRRQPDKIIDKDKYDVLMLAAPIFDQDGKVAFNLCVGGFSQPLTGAALKSYADQLVQSCVDIMRSNRYRLRFRA